MPKQVFYKISNERKIKLLKPAIKEFVSKPYEKITVSSLTDTMHILRTDFYYYFSDKEDIYEEIMKNLESKVKEANPEAKPCEVISFIYDIATSLKGTRNKQYLADLTENYHPMFADELATRIRNFSTPCCEGVEGQIKVMSRINLLMIVVNQYAKGNISAEEGKELLAVKH